MNTWYGNYSPQVAIFDAGISRSNTIGEAGGGAYFIQASPDASILYVVNGDGTQGYAVNPLTFIPYAINASGIGAALTNLPGYSSEFKIENDLLFTDNGQVLDLQDYTERGTFPVSGLVAPDLTNDVVYFLVSSGSPYSPTWTLEACSTNMVNIVWQFTVPNVNGIAHSLIPCGSGLFAFATSTPPGYPNGYPVDPFNQLVFLNTSVAPGSGDLVLGVTANSAFAGANLTNTFTVLNDGPYNASGVVFTNALAPGSTFIAAASTQGVCTQTNGVVTCNIGAMMGGSSVTITVVSSVPYTGSIALQASISKSEPDLDPSNNQISLTEEILPPPSVTVSSTSVFRQSGITANFEVILGSPSSQPFSLYCYTTDGSAKSPGDYLSTGRSVAFPPGATNVNVSVTIEDNGMVESNVVFYLNVSVSPLAAPLAAGSCTLINDDFYNFVVSNTSAAVNSSGLTNVVFFVTLSGPNSMPSSVDYFTRDGNAVAGRDYLGKAGTLVFPPGITNESVSIPVYGADDSVPVKTFYFILGNPLNAILGTSQAAASILKFVIEPGQLLSDGRFRLTVNGGVSGQSYVLLASTNLSNWTAISGFVDTNPPITIYDPDAVNYSRRFYRIGPLSLAPAMKLGVNAAQPFNSNGFNVMLYALPGLEYEIEGSTDLFNWHPITNFTSTNSRFYFSVPTATNLSQQFYRAVMP
jgi:uncharacterized repeat protein (TIGR01451 family)